MSATNTEQTLANELVDALEALDLARGHIAELLPWAERGARGVAFGGRDREDPIRVQARKMLSQIMGDHYGVEADLWWREL